MADKRLEINMREVGLHYHRCGACGYLWGHGGEHNAIHDIHSCPECGYAGVSNWTWAKLTEEEKAEMEKNEPQHVAVCDECGAEFYQDEVGDTLCIQCWRYEVTGVEEEREFFERDEEWDDRDEQEFSEAMHRGGIDPWEEVSPGDFYDAPLSFSRELIGNLAVLGMGICFGFILSELISIAYTCWTGGKP
jgi:hypothetical protein